MTRIVSIWLPLWPIERLARRRRALSPTPVEARGGDRPPPAHDPANGGPFALVEPVAGALRLYAANRAALAEGLRPGMALADARAALPALISAPAEPARDAQGLLALARWCGRYSPRVNVDGVQAIWIDCDGAAHLVGGERALLQDLEHRLTRAGLTVRLGLADTPAAALGLARFGPDGELEPIRSKLSHLATLSPCPTTPRVPSLGGWAGGEGGSEFTGCALGARMARPGGTAAACEGLPVEALGLEADQSRLLRRLGLKRLGDLMDLPRASLERRFFSQDAARAVLLRLDRLMARAPDPRPALLPQPPVLVRRLLAEPLVALEGFKAIVEGLLEELCADLATQERGARGLTLTAYRVDGSMSERRIGTSAPQRDARHLARLLEDKLTTIDAGFGIDAVTLAAPRAEPLEPRQTALPEAPGPTPRQALHAGLTAPRRRPSPFARLKDDPPGNGPRALIDRLSNRLGPARVLRARAQASHVPERAERFAAAIETSDGGSAEHEGDKPAFSLNDRPMLLLAPPEPVWVIAEIPEGPPVRFVWRRVPRRVRRAQGPERIEPEWWRLLEAQWPGGRDPHGRRSGGAAPPDQAASWLGAAKTIAARDWNGLGDDSKTSVELSASGGEGARSDIPERETGGGAIWTLNLGAGGARDYYRIEDEAGGRFWLFREGLYGAARPSWFLHGVFG